jgi:acetylglutamate/LysW-gamma-L-alpha-aminoadipate kinase
MILVKIGGGKSINLKEIVADLSSIKDKFILIHGANALRDELAATLNIAKTTVTSTSGYSSVLSDEQAIDLLMMAYAGLRNKRIVELCQQAGINAIGLSGLDAQSVKGKRNRGIKVNQGSKRFILRDFSGKPQQINRTFIDLLMTHNYTPVLSVPIMDEKGTAINSENDDIVTLLHKEYQAIRIIQLIEAPGLLKNPSDPSSVIKVLSQEDIQKWEDQVVGRMKRKLLALRKLMSMGPVTIHISDGRINNPISRALAGEGTNIRIMSNGF